jgi:hypothetical protein
MTARVERAWDEYQRRIFAGMTVTATQRTETRRAFYAGVFATLTECLALGGEAVSEDAGADALQGMLEECQRFHALVRGGKA